MVRATYHTLIPSSLHPFCEEMALKFSEIERHLYSDLKKGHSLKDLKREYQLRFGINARHFNSIKSSLQGKIRSRSLCHSRQLKELTGSIKGLKKKISQLEKKLNLANASCAYGQSRKSYRKALKFQIHQKKRKLARQQAKLTKLSKREPSLIFGSRKLWSAQFNLEANGYKDHQEWLKDWRAARASQFMLVGSHDEPAGCRNCQLEVKKLSIRVPYFLEGKYGQTVADKKGLYVVIEELVFPYGQEEIDWALSSGIAITYRFVCKKKQWYLFATIDRREVPIQTSLNNGCLGIDLNPDLIGWSYCDREGNLKKFGQIKVNLQDRSTHQTEATLADAVKELVEIASDYNCPIAVELLDFSVKKASMKEQGVRYSRMLSNFSYSKFFELLTSRANRWGVEVISVNPAYSSLIGLVKFMSMYGMSSDTAAALVLARRAFRHSERPPAKYARFPAVQKKRHVWSFWRALGKKVHSAYSQSNKRLSRHDYFHSRTANSRVVVTLLEGKASGRKSKRRRKPKVA